MTRDKKITSDPEDVGSLEREKPAVETGAENPFGNLEVDTSLKAEKEAKSPFADYPQLLLEVFLRPPNPGLERWDKADLLMWCMKNDIYHRDWTLKRDVVSKRDEHLMVKGITTDWSADKIRQWIFGRLTRRVPSHWVVFNLSGDTKPGLAHSRGVKSWITKRFMDCTFDLQWPLSTPRDPYVIGRENQCCVVDDDTVRAQLFYVRKAVTGEVIRRCIDPPKNRQPMYGLFKRDAPALVILERIYRNGTKGSGALRQWAKEAGSLPTAI